MKKNFLFLAIFLLFIVIPKSYSQVVLSLNPVNNGFQVSSKDVLNYTVINNAGLSIKIKYEAVIKDGKGAPLVQITSGEHELKEGINTYLPQTFNIASLKYTVSSIGEVEAKTGYLPSGKYSYCIQIICLDMPKACNAILEGNPIECDNFEIENITPLLLSYPEDKDTIEEKRPNFLWIPPMPIGNSPDISYKLTLVNMNEKQQAEDAIRRNRPIHAQANIELNILPFPPTLSSLEEGKTYAWQVSAFLGNSNIATSDVWEFTIREPKEPDTIRYYKLTQTPGSVISTLPQNSPLYFSMSGRYQNDELSYRLLDEKNDLIEIKVIMDLDSSDTNIKTDEKLFSYGDVKYKVELSEYDLRDGIYTLEVMDIFGKKYYLRFNYKK